jgi:hypothetical protein
MSGFMLLGIVLKKRCGISIPTITIGFISVFLSKNSSYGLAIFYDAFGLLTVPDVADLGSYNSDA